MTQRTVLVVLFDGVQSLDATGPMEVFAGASHAPGVSYELRTASLDGGPVRTTAGLTLLPDSSLAEAPYRTLCWSPAAGAPATPTRS